MNQFISNTRLKHIKKAIRDLDVFDDTAQLFLIKKSKSKKLEKRIKLKRIEIKQEAEFFKGVLKTKLNLLESKISGSTNVMKDFFDEDYDDEDLLEIRPEHIPPFPAFLKKLDDIDNIPKLSELENDEDFDSFAVDFNISNCRIIWFRNIPRNKLIIEKTKKLLSFSSNEFSRIDKPTFSFDRITDAIYFESSSSVIVCNKIQFEKIFDFYEYYQNIANDEFEKLNGDLIMVSEDMVNFEGKIKLSKDIADIIKRGGFPSIEKYKKYNEIFNKLRNDGRHLLEKYTTINIQDDKLEISNEMQRQTFVSIARSDILQEPITGQYYKSLRKFSIET